MRLSASDRYRGEFIEYYGPSALMRHCEDRNKTEQQHLVDVVWSARATWEPLRNFRREEEYARKIKGERCDNV